ncbi:hypothetical protein STREPTOSP366_25140 [Streptomyces variabilis]
MLSRENLLVALNRVEVNGGAPGVDGMTTAGLRPWVAVHWPEVRAELDAGIYRPAPVRQVIIPKPGGGERLLGVPRVLDRLVQQAVAQVLVPLFDPEFSGSSFGFRPGRSAHQAVRVARRAVEDGNRWVVEWLHRRMRQIRWKEWKRYAAKRRILRVLGIGERAAREWAASSKGYWRIAGSVVLQRALPDSHWEDLGLRMLKPTWQRLRSA